MISNPIIQDVFIDLDKADSKLSTIELGFKLAAEKESQLNKYAQHEPDNLTAVSDGHKSVAELESKYQGVRKARELLDEAIKILIECQ